MHFLCLKIVIDSIYLVLRLWWFFEVFWEFLMSFSVTLYWFSHLQSLVPFTSSFVLNFHFPLGFLPRCPGAAFETHCFTAKSFIKLGSSRYYLSWVIRWFNSDSLIFITFLRIHSFEVPPTFFIPKFIPKYVLILLFHRKEP